MVFGRVHILQLYKDILRHARSLPPPVARKVARNTRQVFDLHRGPAEEGRLQQLYADGQAAVRVLKWLASLDQVGDLPWHSFDGLSGVLL